jgi:hypothetical protein
MLYEVSNITSVVLSRCLRNNLLISQWEKKNCVMIIQMDRETDVENFHQKAGGMCFINKHRNQQRT